MTNEKASEKPAPKKTTASKKATAKKSAPAKKAPAKQSASKAKTVATKKKTSTKAPPAQVKNSEKVKAVIPEPVKEVTVEKPKTFVAQVEEKVTPTLKIAEAKLEPLVGEVKDKGVILINVPKKAVKDVIKKVTHK